MEANVAAVQNSLEVVDRFDEIARLLTGTATARAGDGVKWIRDLCRDLKIPRLAAFDIRRADFAEIAEKAAGSSSMKGNPVALTRAQLLEILERAS